MNKKMVAHVDLVSFYESTCDCPITVFSCVCSQEGAGQVLSLCIRIYCHSRSSPTVVSTAAATVRQAVALLFDHAVLESSGSSSGISGVATQKEVAAVLLLQDLMNMCAGELVLNCDPAH